MDWEVLEAWDLGELGQTYRSFSSRVVSVTAAGLFSMGSWSSAMCKSGHRSGENLMAAGVLLDDAVISIHTW